MSEQYEALNPEDIGLLVGIAGPLYAESKLIDAMTGTRPQDSNGAIVSGTDQLKRGLENIVQNAVRTPTSPSFQPPPQYHVPPQVEQIPMPTHYYESTPTTAIDCGFPKKEDPQLEFDFSLTEQKKTNELLEKNNKLLQKLIRLLELKEKHEEPIKLEVGSKGIQNLPPKSVKN